MENVDISASRPQTSKSSAKKLRSSLAANTSPSLPDDEYAAFLAKSKRLRKDRLLISEEVTDELKKLVANIKQEQAERLPRQGLPRRVKGESPTPHDLQKFEFEKRRGCANTNILLATIYYHAEYIQYTDISDVREFPTLAQLFEENFPIKWKDERKPAKKVAGKTIPRKGSIILSDSERRRFFSHPIDQRDEKLETILHHLLSVVNSIIVGESDGDVSESTAQFIESCVERYTQISSFDSPEREKEEAKEMETSLFFEKMYWWALEPAVGDRKAQQLVESEDIFKSVGYFRECLRPRENLPEELAMTHRKLVSMLWLIRLVLVMAPQLMDAVSMKFESPREMIADIVITYDQHTKRVEENSSVNVFDVNVYQLILKTFAASSTIEELLGEVRKIRAHEDDVLLPKLLYSGSVPKSASVEQASSSFVHVLYTNSDARGLDTDIAESYPFAVQITDECNCTLLFHLLTMIVHGRAPHADQIDDYIVEMEYLLDMNVDYQLPAFLGEMWRTPIEYAIDAAFADPENSQVQKMAGKLLAKVDLNRCNVLTGDSVVHYLFRRLYKELSAPNRSDKNASVVLKGLLAYIGDSEFDWMRLNRKGQHAVVGGRVKLESFFKKHLAQEDVSVVSSKFPQRIGKMAVQFFVQLCQVACGERRRYTWSESNKSFFAGGDLVHKDYALCFESASDIMDRLSSYFPGLEEDFGLPVDHFSPILLIGSARYRGLRQLIVEHAAVSRNVAYGFGFNVIVAALFLLCEQGSADKYLSNEKALPNDSMLLAVGTKVIRWLEGNKIAPEVDHRGRPMQFKDFGALLLSCFSSSRLAKMLDLSAIEETNVIPRQAPPWQFSAELRATLASAILYATSAYLETEGVPQGVSFALSDTRANVDDYELAVSAVNDALICAPQLVDVALIPFRTAPDLSVVWAHALRTLAAQVNLAGNWQDNYRDSHMLRQCARIAHSLCTALTSVGQGRGPPGSGDDIDIDLMVSMLQCIAPLMDGCARHLFEDGTVVVPQSGQSDGDESYDLSSELFRLCAILVQNYVLKVMMTTDFQNVDDHSVRRVNTMMEEAQYDIILALIWEHSPVVDYAEGVPVPTVHFDLDLFRLLFADKGLSNMSPIDAFRILKKLIVFNRPNMSRLSEVAAVTRDATSEQATRNGLFDFWERLWSMDDETEMQAISTAVDYPLIITWFVHHRSRRIPHLIHYIDPFDDSMQQFLERFVKFVNAPFIGIWPWEASQVSLSPRWLELSRSLPLSLNAYANLYIAFNLFRQKLPQEMEQDLEMFCGTEDAVQRNYLMRLICARRLRLARDVEALVAGGRMIAPNRWHTDATDSNVFHHLLSVMQFVDPYDTETYVDTGVELARALVQNLDSKMLGVADQRGDLPLHILARSISRDYELVKFVTDEELRERMLQTFELFQRLTLDVIVQDKSSKNNGEDPFDDVIKLLPSDFQEEIRLKKSRKSKAYYIKTLLALAVFLSDAIQYHSFPFTVSLLWAVSLDSIVTFFRAFLLDVGFLLSGVTFQRMYWVLLAFVASYVGLALALIRCTAFRRWVRLEHRFGGGRGVNFACSCTIGMFVALVMQTLGYIVSGVAFVPIVRHMFGIYDCTFINGMPVLDSTGEDRLPCYSDIHIAQMALTALLLPHFLYFSLRLGNVLNLFTNFWELLDDVSGERTDGKESEEERESDEEKGKNAQKRVESGIYEQGVMRVTSNEDYDMEEAVSSPNEKGVKRVKEGDEKSEEGDDVEPLVKAKSSKRKKKRKKGNEEEVQKQQMIVESNVKRLLDWAVDTNLAKKLPEGARKLFEEWLRIRVDHLPAYHKAWREFAARVLNEKSLRDTLHTVEQNEFFFQNLSEKSKLITEAPKESAAKVARTNRRGRWYQKFDGNAISVLFCCICQLISDFRGNPTRHPPDAPKFGASDFHMFQPSLKIRSSQYLIQFSVKVLFCLLSVLITNYSLALSVCFLLLSLLLFSVAILQPKYHRRRINAMWSAMLLALVWTQVAAVWTTIVNGTRREVIIGVVQIDEPDGPVTSLMFGIGWIVAFVVGGALSLALNNLRRFRARKSDVSEKSAEISMEEWKQATGEEEEKEEKEEKEEEKAEEKENEKE